MHIGNHFKNDTYYFRRLLQYYPQEYLSFCVRETIEIVDTPCQPHGVFFLLQVMVFFVIIDMNLGHAI